MAPIYFRVLLVVLTFSASMGAAYRTANFVVTAPSAEVAEKIGNRAEQCRKEQALLWFGKELPTWQASCSIKVSITIGEGKGATKFAFDKGRVISMDMTVEGLLDRLMEKIIPHEVTHAIMAHHFGSPVPRWFDEGAAILAENAAERDRQLQRARATLGDTHRAVPLRRLFHQQDYPNDLAAFYSQGYSVTQFLLEQGNRRLLLEFVADGMKGSWNKALQKHYRILDTDTLEAAWLADLKASKSRVVTSK